jgi:hypothetical protein
MKTRPAHAPICGLASGMGDVPAIRMISSSMQAGSIAALYSQDEMKVDRDARLIVGLADCALYEAQDLGCKAPSR